MSARATLEDLTRRFTDAFNRNDLDAALAFFSDDAVYDEFNGRTHRGREAIREAFLPQFRGDYGTVRFEIEDIFADDHSNKTLVRWLCVIERSGDRRAWRGLDVLQFENGRLKHKSTYAKAPAPALQS
jgi:ketosteroid isomerase-like protein